MLGRHGNNLFWMARYMERSYGLLNLIITNYNSTLDSGDYSSWNRILKTYMGIGEEMNNHNHKDSISIIAFIIFNQENPNTIINMIIKARENARSVQEHISRELWLSVNKYYLSITDEKMMQIYKKSDTIEFVNDLIQFNHIYYSIADLTQERGNAYCFMNLGKYIETKTQADMIMWDASCVVHDEFKFQGLKKMKKLVLNYLMENQFLTFYSFPLFISNLTFN